MAKKVLITGITGMVGSHLVDLLLKKRSPYIEPKTLKYLREYNKKIFVTKDLNQLVYGSNLTHLVLPTPSLKNNSFSNKYLIKIT